MRRIFCLFILTATACYAAVPAQPYVWRNVTIVAGGFVPGIIFSPEQRGVIYARTDIGGAYRWEAEGRRWIPLNDWVGPDDANLMGCESIAPDPVDANKVYMAMGTYRGGGAAILRSGDQGRTFQITHVPFAMGGNENGRGVGERLAVDPGNTHVLYFASRHDGLWTSGDAAVSWRKVVSFPALGGGDPYGMVSAGLSFVVFDAGAGRAGSATASIYVGGATRGSPSLFHSGDAGKTWRAVPGAPPDLLAHHGQIDSTGMLYVAFSNGPGPNGVTSGAVGKFDTHSGKWTNISPYIGPDGISDFGYGGLSLDRQHPGTLLVSTLNHWKPGDDIFRTTDGGRTWESLRNHSTRDAALAPYLIWGDAEPNFGWWIAAVALDPFDSNHALYGTGATIWGTDDLTQVDQGRMTHWSVAAPGLEETAVLDLISPPAGPHLISGLGDIGGFEHDDFDVSPAGGMLSNPMFDNTSSLDFAQNDPAVLVRTGTPHGRGGASCAFSTDGGKTWKPMNAGRSANRFGRGGAVIVSADGGTFLSMRAAPAISRDQGKTWIPCRGLPNGVRIIADRGEGRRFYALSMAGNRLYSSTDGENFTVTPVGGFPPVAQGRGGFFFFGGPRLAAVPGRAGDLWLFGRDGLYHSPKLGEDFVKVAAVQSVTALGFGKAAAGGEYPAMYLSGGVAGTEAVYRSDDEGKTWMRINDEQHQYGSLPGVVIGDPRIFGRVYIGTNGRGVLYGDPVAEKTR